MASRIITKKGSGAPLASDLVHGELAVDTVNKRLYTENASGVVIEVGTSPSTIDINAGTIDNTVIGGTTPAAVTTTALVATTADINGGTIDGTVIGGSTAAAGSFTTGQFNTSLNVDGTVTAEGLDIDNPGGSSAKLVYSNNDQGNLRIQLENTGAGGNTWELVGGLVGVNNADFTIYDATNTAKRALFSNNGDISFYEDTGTTPKMVWKASDERLGIGTSSPKGHLSINGLNITFLSRAYTMSTTPVEVLLLDNQGNSPVFIRVYRGDTSSPQGSELIELYIACFGSGSAISSVSLVQDDKVQIGSIHNVTFTAAIVSNNVHISVTGDDAGGEAQNLNFECHHIAGTITLL